MARGVRSASTRHRHHALNHPAVNDGLERTITFQKQVPEEELVALVSELQAQGLVSVSDTNVSYSLPG
jgi:hypothetical protein